MISNIVIDSTFNLVIFITKLKELLIECLQLVFSKKDQDSIIKNSFKVNKIYNLTNTI